MIKKVSVIGIVSLLLMGCLVLPAFAAEKQAVGGMLEPAKATLINVGAYLPKLGVLLVVLVIGSLIAIGVTALIGWLLKIIRLEEGAKKAKITEILKKGGIGLSLSGLIIEIVFFLIIVGTLITALEYYGVSTNDLVGQMLSYIPNVIAATFVLILGILLAILLSGIIKLVGGNVKIAQTETLGNIAKYAVIVVAGLAALKQLGLGVIMTDKSKDIILGGLVLALALSFGMGAKEKAGKFLDGVFKK